MLYVNHREQHTKVLGPGIRYVLWLQGCKKKCPGCLYPAGRPLNQNGYWLDSKVIIDEIKKQPLLTGITISGGEPFLQAKELAGLIRQLKAETTLDIMLYSGYTLEKLRAEHNIFINYILEHSDLLIDGEYKEELNTNQMYRGSDNQVIHYLSPKYKAFKDIIENTKNRSVEFVYRNNEMFIIGIPAKDFNKSFWQAALERKNRICEDNEE